MICLADEPPVPGEKKRKEMCMLQLNIRLYHVADLNIQLPVEQGRGKKIGGKNKDKTLAGQ